MDPSQRGSGESTKELEELRSHIALELATPVRASVSWLADEIQRRHGDSVLGILFYGSCLRSKSDEGVFDFWVVVEDYDAAYERKSFAFLNRFAAPNVFYLERPYEGGTLRTKYGVIDRAAFERGTALASLHPYVWARFSQPARLLACRDDAARRFFAARVSEAVVTLVARLVVFLPNQGRVSRFSLAAFWLQAFRRTYDSERRPEAEESIRGLYRADETRYDTIAALALTILANRGYLLRATAYPRSCEIEIAPHRRHAARLRWRWLRPYARTLGLVRLLKTSWTFGDWVPYVLWKLERHTGRRIEPSERQRRHPLIFGWPIIIPLLLRRNLR